MNDVIIYEYNNAKIEFQLNGQKNVKINATQMAKIFGKQVIAFLRNDDTKRFIDECLKSENSHFLNIESREDLISSKQKSGTFMHRVLALKFAAWLNPAFELWVFMMIEKIIFGHFEDHRKRLENKAENITRIENLEKELSQNKTFIELQGLRKAVKKNGADARKADADQLNFLKQMFQEENQ